MNSNSKLQTSTVSRPFVVVAGIFCSGTSCLAGVLHHLGLYFGNRLSGYYGGNPNQSCSFEDSELRDICEQSIRFPETKRRLRDFQTYWLMRDWMAQLRQQANERNMMAACKHPLLCQLNRPLVAAGGDHMRLIVSQRPIAESIESLSRRERKRFPTRVGDHQKWLEEGKQQLMGMIPSEWTLKVSYRDLLCDTQQQIERLVEFLDIKPTQRQREFAAEWVDPAKRNVFEGVNA